MEEEEKTWVPPYILYKTIYGEREEEAEVRQVIIRGLVPVEMYQKVLQILKKTSGEKFIRTLARTAWNTFYEQVWRIRCEKVNEWEEDQGITNKMKRRVLAPRNTRPQKNGSQQNKEEKKKREEEKEIRVKEEVMKTVKVLVIEGGRSFYYGL